MKFHDYSALCDFKILLKFGDFIEILIILMTFKRILNEISNRISDFLPIPIFNSNYCSAAWALTILLKFQNFDAISTASPILKWNFKISIRLSKWNISISAYDFLCLLLNLTNKAKYGRMYPLPSG